MNGCTRFLRSDLMRWTKLHRKDWRCLLNYFSSFLHFVSVSVCSVLRAFIILHF